MDEQALRQELAFAYQIFAFLKMDDLTYTHLSARLPGADCYHIYPLGQLFEEVTPESLLTVTFDGKVISGTEAQYNQTGFNIHGSIYRARPDINAIFHLHTLAGVAVSAMADGLLPISQFSFHFYNRISYHTYNALVLESEQGNLLVEDLGTHNKAMFLRNHGTLTCGVSLQEAFFYAYYLEQACKVQCQALACNNALIFPDRDVCEKAAKDMRAFEQDLGLRDWQAMKRRLMASKQSKSL